jgi:hypothetical protein
MAARVSVFVILDSGRSNRDKPKKMKTMKKQTNVLGMRARRE